MRIPRFGTSTLVLSDDIATFAELEFYVEVGGFSISTSDECRVEVSFDGWTTVDTVAVVQGAFASDADGLETPAQAFTITFERDSEPSWNSISVRFVASANRFIETCAYHILRISGTRSAAASAAIQGLDLAASELDASVASSSDANTSSTDVEWWVWLLAAIAVAGIMVGVVFVIVRQLKISKTLQGGADEESVDSFAGTDDELDEESIVGAGGDSQVAGASAPAGVRVQFDSAQESSTATSDVDHWDQDADDAMTSDVTKSFVRELASMLDLSAADGDGDSDLP